jgi:methylated-DNA-protein-cysteine methyltransferase-like protein
LITLKGFPLKTEARNTGMFAKVLATVRRIPRGRISTYGEVAAASGHPGAARQVVWALRAGQNVPWHRVVGAGGRIRLPGENGLEQRLRLRNEGVAIAGDKIDLKQFGYVFVSATGSRAAKLKKLGKS